MSSSSRLPRATPESQGVDSAAIARWLRAADAQIRLHHSFLLLRHGQVIAEGSWQPYDPAAPHVLFSLSKSFTSSAVGMAVAEGLLSVDDPVIRFFPESLPADVSENLAAMRVHHLLSMTTGHDFDTTWEMVQAPDGDWARKFLSFPVAREPGSFFLYNTGATYMLSAIVQRLTGQKLIDYLGPRLFAPLGMEGMGWMEDPRGVNTGGWGMSARVEDIARFGQLYLQRGEWRGQQLIDAGWVEQATRKQTYSGEEGNAGVSDWEQGYGYQFWRCHHNAYRGDGAFGQYCVVIPEHDVVVAITSGLGDMQEPLNLIWEHLLPAFGSAPLPENPAAQAALADLVGGLVAPLPAREISSPLEDALDGKVFTLAPHPAGVEALGFAFAPDYCTLTVRKDGIDYPIELGRGAWRPGTTGATAAFFPGTPMMNAGTFPQESAAAAWSTPDTLLLDVRHYSLPLHYTLSCQFAGDSVVAQLVPSQRFGEETIAPFEGTSA